MNTKTTKGYMWINDAKTSMINDINTLSMAQKCMTDYELISIIGQRENELSCNSPAYVEYDNTMSIKQIAIKELEEGVLPICISRDIISKTIIVRVKDLDLSTVKEKLDSLKTGK